MRPRRRRRNGNFLWVVPIQYQLKHLNDTEPRKAEVITSATVDDFCDYIVTNFDAMIYESSMHYMKPNSTVITIDVVNGTQDGLSGDIITPEDTLKAINEGNITVKKGTFDKAHLEKYDHVATCFSCTNSAGTVEFPFGGLGGWRFNDSATSYSLTRLSNDLGLSTEDKAYKANGYKTSDGKLKSFYYAELVVHEFMHGIEYLFSYYCPNAMKRDMPSPDGFTTYYGEVANADLMNDFYKYFFNGGVPVAKGSSSTFGMKKEDFAKAPHILNTPLSGTVSVGTADAWNMVTLINYFGGTAPGAVISLTDNIDFNGKGFIAFPSFSGTINGNGYALINANLGNDSLVGCLGEDGAVRDLLMINVIVNAADGYRVGAIAGQCYGEISSCGVTGLVSGEYMVGGICGALEDGGSIRDCFNGATVSCTDSCVAGICGYAASGSELDNCFNYGVVSTTGGDTPMAVVHAVTDKISHCYSLGGMSCFYDDCTAKTEEEMKSEEFLALLNQNHESSFKAGTKYPTIAKAKYGAESFPTGRLFSDAGCSSSVSQQRLYVSGAKIKTGDVTVNYKAATLYTSIKVPEYEVTSSSGKVSNKKGKIIVGVTSTSATPTLSKNKFPKSTATDTAKVAFNASKGTFTVTAGNKPGTVYAWIISVSEPNKIEEISCVEVTVLDTPAKITVQTKNYDDPTAKTVKKAELGVSGSITV